MRFYPTSITYTTHAGLIVWLCGRLENGDRLEIPLDGTEPHFYVDEPVKPHESIVRSEPSAAVNMYGQSLNKIVVQYPPDAPEVRQEYINPYESDIPYHRRIRYDYGIMNCIELPEPIPDRLTPDMIHPVDGSIRPRIFTLDIETYYKKKGGTAAYPSNPVNCVTFKDSYSKKYLTIFVGQLTERQQDELYQKLAAPDLDIGRTEPLKVKLLQVSDEYQLFAKLKGTFDALKPDVVRGWNMVEFDWAYLKNRAAQRSYLSPRWERIEPFDSMLAYKKLHERSIGKPKDGVSLDAVAKNEGFGNKVEYDGDLVRLYEDNPVDFIYYNIIDVYLSDAIDEGTFGGCTDNYLRIARMAGCSLEDTQSEMAVVDSYTFHMFRGRFVQPSKSRAEERKVRGGKVFQSKKGVYRLTLQVDNSQEYSAMIRSGNISPETKIPDDQRHKYRQEDVIISPNGTWYRKDIRGVFPDMLDGMTKDQDNFQRLYDETGDVAWKNLRQANKNINHSFFGNFLNPYWRNYDPDIGSDILAYAREHLNHNADMIRELGGVVIYGDTDSCYFTLPDIEGADAKMVRAREIVDELNASYPDWCAQWGMEECHLKVKLECDEPYYGQLFTPLASGKGDAKKRYVVIERGEIKGSNEIFEWNGEKFSMTIKGFQAVRSDSTPLTREIQPSLFKVLLMEDDYTKQAIKLIKKVIDRVHSGDIPIEDLRIPIGLGKNPEEYARPTFQSKAALFSNSYLDKEFREGDKISAYYGYVEGLPRTDCFALEWNEKVPKAARVDKDKHIERALEKPLSTVLDAAGLNWKDIKAGVVAQTLEDFF